MVPSESHRWPQKDRGRATSPAVTAPKECLAPPFTISLSLHPWWPRQTQLGDKWAAWPPNPTPSRWLETTWTMFTPKPPLPKQLSISPRNQKMRSTRFGLCLRQKLCGAVRMAIPKTQPWGLAKRIFLFSFFPLLTCIWLLQWVWKANPLQATVLEGVSSGLSL